jgi:hypothetical protein
MGHIAEPKGVDFLINSQPLNDKEREELSEHIRKRKIELKRRSEFKRRPKSKAKPKA